MERFIQVGQAQLWTFSEGKGPPLLLCNGGPGCDDYLGPVADMFMDLCQVIRFEPRGCGRSDWDGQYTLETSLDDVEAIRQAYGIDRWLLCGHSAGVDTALAYALAFPQSCKGLIGLAGGRIVNDRDWHADYKSRQASEGEPGDDRIWQADPKVNQVGNQSWKQFIKQPDLLKALSQLDVPAYFIQAGKDIRPHWPTRQLAALLPQGYYEEIPAASHMLWLTHPTELKRLLRSTVRKLL